MTSQQPSVIVFKPPRHMDIWTYGHMDIWTYGHMDLRRMEEQGLEPLRAVPEYERASGRIANRQPPMPVAAHP